ncbi:MAG: M15 family metallopeptidase [Pseudomonadales bacterium]
MDRRDFLKIFSAGTVAAMGGQLAWRVNDVPFGHAIYEDIPTDQLDLARSIELMSTPAPDPGAFLRAFEGRASSHVVASNDLDAYLEKMSNFESAHQDDVFLEPPRYAVLISTFKRLDRVQNLVGHGNFNVLSFDEMLKYSSRYESVGAFTKNEKEFLEELFTSSAEQYGFYGQKVIDQITAIVPDNDRIKVPYTGHFLYKGDSFRLYEKVRKDVGGNVVLTSGIRSVVKQSHLFLAKTIQAKGNLSRASRSLAPPGHSFHGIGDFDVGKIGYGARNFTSEFARTEEFKRLVDLGYIDMRYPRDNLLGVRYEPWHIKVV